MTVLLAALGASLGAALRFVAAHRYDAPPDRGLPWGTVGVNVAGSLMAGVLAGSGVPSDAVALLGTGFCGGLTTYSAFALQTHRLGWRRGALVVLLTGPPALLACALGYAAARAVPPYQP